MKMKPQEIWSQTYNHLWHCANSMLVTAPTISAHLARTLVSSVPEDGMSALATRLHCQKCSALMINAKVRVRKLKKRPRRTNKSVKNLVLRTCSTCGNTNAERGAERVAPSETSLKEVAELRKEIAKQRRRVDAQASKGEGDGGRARDSKSKEGSRAVVDGRIKKKKKKKKGRRSRNNSHNEQSTAPTTGLAASFLFEPIP